eukprot:7227544-Alexandrium_andersonii.AAC.1
MDVGGPRQPDEPPPPELLERSGKAKGKRDRASLPGCRFSGAGIDSSAIEPSQGGHPWSRAGKQQGASSWGPQS